EFFARNRELLEEAEELEHRVRLDAAMRELLGLPAGTAELPVADFCAAVHVDDRGPFTGTRRTSAAVTYHFRVTTPGGRVRTLLGWSDTGQGLDGGDDGCGPRRGMALDASGDERRASDLVRLVHSDGLTGLPNRALLDARLAAALAGAGPRRNVLLLLLDLDRFKLVNDTLGHQVGDALLRQVAERLRTTAPPGSTLARLGGDEFVLCVPDVERPESALALARNVARVLRAPHQLPGTPEPLVCTASVGVAVASSGSADELFRSADTALYRAKDLGRDRCAVYDSAMRDEARARHDSETRLRRALREDGLRLLWQPVVDLRERRTVAAECLVRLHDDVAGLLEPAAFVDTAEETGLIVDVDSWVLQAALRQLARWHGRGERLQVAFNVSGRTLEHPAFAHRLASSVQRHGALGAGLLAEITERTLIDLSPPTRASLQELRSVGASIGLDDFGTGYSSLAYLDRFPLGFLKIDRSFVTPLGTSARADAVVEALIALAHAHGMVVTAEGVETELQAHRLLRMGCDRAQGWLFGRPVPAAELLPER
ncbi:bifunctional diguanylate cyclase/phosphodiesterase, partial [Kineococcus glutinatus]|uniref:putative bifunctional diguanylate cyclase/phosphodiesterase n=1 Tax=Kineococcus glutinatus TaxID=1070872 RepID=UPI0031E9ADDB